MTAPADPAPLASRPAPDLAESGPATQVVAAASVALLYGGLTSYLQSGLPEPLLQLANSATGWTLPAVVLVLVVRLRPRWSALAGCVCFIALVLGYAAVSQLRGLTYDPVLWSVVGLVVGPFVGTAAGWLRCDGWRRGVAVALLAGIALGEAWYGLTVVVASTGWFYWVLSGLAGVGLLVVGLPRRTTAPVAAASVAGAVLVAVCFRLAYAALGGV